MKTPDFKATQVMVLKSRERRKRSLRNELEGEEGKK
jgi:hypothetical protein